jgi:hypothetical protein
LGGSGRNAEQATWLVGGKEVIKTPSKAEICVVVTKGNVL